MSDSSQATPPPPTHPKRAWRSPAALTLFFAVTLAVLAGDLVLKYWAFENVVGVPVRVQNTAQGPTIQVDQPGIGWVTMQPKRVDEPASAMPDHPPIRVLPGILSLRLTINTGAVFGLGKGAQWLFAIISVGALFVIAWLFIRSPAWVPVWHTALALVTAGAAGNLYDRLLYKAVRDMLHLFPDTGLWPWIFNLADVALMVGVGMIVLLSFYRDWQQQRRQKQQADGTAPG